MDVQIELCFGNQQKVLTEERLTVSVFDVKSYNKITGF